MPFLKWKTTKTPSAVSQALYTDLILARIFHISDFSKLRDDLRLVSKYWNTIASAVLRRRSLLIHLEDRLKWRDYDRLLDAHLANRDIIAALPLEVTIGTGMGNLSRFLQQGVAAVRWRYHIKRLSISYTLTIGDANRVTPFLLEQLPNLLELQLTLGGELDFLGDWALGGHAAGSRFNLDSIEYVQYQAGWESQMRLKGGTIEETLDPTFLWHCPTLKTFAMRDMEIASAICDTFLGFFDIWEKMVLEDPTFHRIPNIKFHIAKALVASKPYGQCIQLNQDLLKTYEMQNALTQFINWNQPTSVELSRNFDYGFPALFSKIQFSRSALRSLTVDVPVVTRSDKSATFLILELLKKFHVFAQLTEIRLWLRDRNEGKPCILNGSQVTGTDVHQLPKVTSLVVRSRVEFGMVFASMLEAAAVLVPSVARLEVDLAFYANSWRRRRDDELGPIFSACQKFYGLEELCLNVAVYGSSQEDYNTIAWRKSKIAGGQSQGYFKGLEYIESLKKLRVKIRAPALKPEMALVTLFYGYEPRVDLELEILPSLNSEGSNDGDRHKLWLPKREFKAALEKAKLHEFYGGGETTYARIWNFLCLSC